MEQRLSAAHVVSVQASVGDPRVRSMFNMDCLAASVLLLVLWLLYAFVLYEVWPNTGQDNTGLALIISGGLVLLFNAASIIAMIKHYSDDKEHIYGLDLHYLDIMQRVKR